MRVTPLIDPRTARVQSVSALGLGCSQVGALGHPASLMQWDRLIAHALDLGVTVLDTADIYGQGDSERAIGRVLEGRRGAAVVVTKVGQGFSPLMGALRPLKPMLGPILRAAGSGAAVRARREGFMRNDFSPAHLTAALEASLRRLRLDHVDVLLLHGPPAAVYRDPAVVETLATLVQAGKARRVGASCEALEDLEAALSMPGLGAIQLSQDLLDAAQAAGLAHRLAADGRLVMLRQVVRAQPGLGPAAAVAAASHRAGVACVIVGTSRIDHLEVLARACA